MDPRIFEIVSAKPELVDTFPRWMLSETTENELKNTEGLAIVEIAGRDSIAAALEAVKERDFKAFLPTIVYTGTEFGSWKVTFKKVDMLREVLSKRGVKIFDPIVLGAPRFWWRLCGRYITHLFESFGFYSPCVGCHLYLHAIRIPLARKIECGVMIAGERESHEGKIKINQIGVALDAYISFAEKFGVELFLPLRQVSKSKDIESIISQHWEESGEQLECVLSKNYQDIGGNVVYSEGDIRRFFDEFALKEAEDTIKKFLSFHDS
ncbi:MAG: hypothetical protein JRF49_12545 [Deltaproteobacteria bacterium]|nr:hypothetical protein [Deltaproteobacteria bacterium]